MDAFEIRNLTFFYPEQDRPAIDALSLSVKKGEFFVLCGPSGCGKSTLLRQLKPALTPHGRRTGEIMFEGRPLDALEPREQASRIGFVLQSPENQVVTDKVWHELAFGLESLGYDTPQIRRRVAEMASFFGIEDWFYRDVAELSGGQKQLLNLASVMVMQPSALILDEPTSQLDPIAASDFLATLGKINRELGTTVILTEHRLEEAFPLSDTAAVLDRGRVVCTGTPAQVGAKLRDGGHAMFLAMPTAMRVWAAVQSDGDCPVTVREGRGWLERFAAENPLQKVPPKAAHTCSDEPAITVGDLWFRYDKELPDVVRGLKLEVKKGDFLALLGGNGAGKTTALNLIAGILKPHRGQVQRSGRVAMLPQNPQTLFVKKTVREDLFEIFAGSGMKKEEQDRRAARIVRLCMLEGLLDRHPYDLSGGEQQRAALAKVLLTQPEILLLDEPTKGLDAEFKQTFAEILKKLLQSGVTVVMVSHDVEFCALYAHRCALFFDGSIVAQGTPREFFSDNNFYTTAANRISRGIVPDAVTPQDLITACGGKSGPASAVDDAQELPELPSVTDVAPSGPQKLPWWRKLIAAVFAAFAAVLFIHALGVTDLTKLVGENGLTRLAGNYLVFYGLLVASLLVVSLAVGRRSKPPVEPPKRRRLQKRTIAAAAVVLLLVPATLFVGTRYFGDRKYYFISLLIVLECMIPFFVVFEGRKPQARELVIIAVLCAISVAGRAALFMLPEFKPVVAMTIIAGVALGGETGFLVGAVSMLVSNIMFSQGPWTPWQMFAMGLIGFLAGIIFRKGLLRRTRLTLAIFGAIVSVVIYGGIMNPAAALIWSHTLNWNVILSYYVTGLPIDLVRAAATFIFLWLAAEPMLEKLDRVKVKYGLLE